MNRGAWFRGRGWAGQHTDDDYLAQKAEADRQRWSYAVTDLENSLLSVDPYRAYEQHRAAYITTGRPGDLAMMLQYVVPDE